jgi:MSHA pilin protein MshD
MSKPATGIREVIPEELIRARLEQSEEMREFYIQMWLQNPELAKQGGQRVQDLLKPLAYSPDDEVAHVTGMIKQRGISLIELIMFIVIISVALVGILLVMNQVTRHSADPLIRKQAMAIAESLLEEVELQDFIDQGDGVTTACPAASAVSTTNRASDYHIVDCYKTLTTTTGINNESLGLSGTYTANVGIAAAALGTVAAGSAVRITVTVTDPQNNQIAIDGYRTKY